MKNKLINIIRRVRPIVVKMIRPKSRYQLIKPRKHVKPLGYRFGYDRGIPIDRYYIEKFMNENKEYVKGYCLEITDDAYIKKYGEGRVTKWDVLDIDTKNKSATIYADLRRAKKIKSNTFDCIIATQTFVVIDDYEAAIKECYRMLKPGGTMLVTMPHITPALESLLWSWTKPAAEYTFNKCCPGAKIKVEQYGNVLVGQAYWVGMSLEELDQKQLDYNDPQFPVIISIVVTKAK